MCNKKKGGKNGTLKLDQVLYPLSSTFVEEILCCSTLQAILSFVPKKQPRRKEKLYSRPETDPE